MGNVGSTVGGVLGAGSSSSTPPASTPPATSQTPTTAQPKPSSSAPASSKPPAQQSSTPASPPASTPASPAPSSPSDGSASEPAPAPTPATSTPETNNDGSNAAGTPDSASDNGASTPTASPKPVVNVASPNASPDPNIPLVQESQTPSAGDDSATHVATGSFATSSVVGQFEGGSSIVTDTSSTAAVGGNSSADSVANSKSSSLPLGASAAIGVFSVLFALLVGLFCYRRMLLAKRRRNRRETGADWDFRDSRNSVQSFASTETAVMESVSGSTVAVHVARHVSVLPSPAPAAMTALSPTTPNSAGPNQPLLDLETGTSVHVLQQSAYVDQTATPTQATAARSLTSSYTPAIVYTPPSTGNAPRASNVSVASTVNPFTLSRPENPVPPLSPLYGNFDDPFASPYDGAVPTTSTQSLALHPENPFHPEIQRA
ncbi:hypothetical protein EXIGLDRAFT_838858 [Exidia glandulosa HHB12029]|uniref:Uncharacterized protein n=1 Tax=Exidia glandulosa HHB12029 TaxID=1314781 RepID=A0A165FG16_EXIGL|nr:hypothetical protein EXIGLDRAFT_838858 [Exidia glandulosa HHB12029]